MTAEQRLRELGVELPPPPKAKGVYKPIVVVDRMAYVSGHGPLKPDGTMTTGRVGSECTLDEGHAAARQTALAIVATLRAHLGSLDRVRRVVKVLGMVNASVDFTEHPAVINGASELFRDLWGEEHGVGARSAVGMGSLPGNIPTEIEAIFEVES